MLSEEVITKSLDGFIRDMVEKLGDNNARIRQVKNKIVNRVQKNHY